MYLYNIRDAIDVPAKDWQCKFFWHCFDRSRTNLLRKPDLMSFWSLKEVTWHIFTPRVSLVAKSRWPAMSARTPYTQNSKAANHEKRDMLSEEEEEIILEFLELFQEREGKEKFRKIDKKRRRRLNRLSRTCLHRHHVNHLYWLRLGGLWCYHSFRIPFSFCKNSFPLSLYRFFF